MKALVCLSALFSAGVALAGVYGDTPDAKHAWAVHDWNRPKPSKVTPAAKCGGAPSDAIVLFDGTEESFKKNWEKDEDKKGVDPTWTVKDGAFTSKVGWGLGSVRTRREFGDCQLHIEYRHNPKTVELGKGPQMRGNSGVFLMGTKYGYEVQVLESYTTSKDMKDKPGYVDNYTDGQAGAVYAENPPLVNPARPAGEWQVYDIVFHQPIWNGDKLVHPGSVTVLFNGVLVQDHWEMEGQTTHCRRRPLKPQPVTGPLALQDHGCEVSYRNIWIRPLASRWANTTHSAMSANEADVMALRRKTASELFAKIANPKDVSFDNLQKLAEVISYANEGEYKEDFILNAKGILAKINGANADEIKAMKKDIDALKGTMECLKRNGVVSKDCPLCAKLATIK